jgi:hypothetical protein
MGRLRRYIEGKQGHVASTLDGVSMYVIGQYGKFAQRSSDAQFNAKTSLRIPVTSTSDVVTVVSYPGYHNYKVGGVAASADKTTHKATTSEVSQGYVEIFSTGNSYLFSISVVQYKYVASFGGTGSNSNGTGNTSGGSNFGVTGISNYDLNSPVGWGTYGGSITGSKNQNAVTVTTADQLVMALSGTDAKTIYVKGKPDVQRPDDCERREEQNSIWVARICLKQCDTHIFGRQNGNSMPEKLQKHHYAKSHIQGSVCPVCVLEKFIL